MNTITKERAKELLKIMLLFVVILLPQYSYCQETATKVLDGGFGYQMDTEVYSNIPLTIDIPSNYKTKYEETPECAIYIYKAGESLIVYSDWPRKRTWNPGNYEITEKQADEILSIASGLYGLDLDEAPWLYKNNRKSFIVSLGNSVCLLYNIKKNNVKKYLDIIKNSFKEL